MKVNNGNRILLLRGGGVPVGGGGREAFCTAGLPLPPRPKGHPSFQKEGNGLHQFFIK